MKTMFTSLLGRPMTETQRKLRNIAKATKARLHGARYARTIADEASRAGIPYAVAFAAVEQESGFRNVFGHDHGGLHPGLPVTSGRVLELLSHVSRGGESNGVGLTQLTFPPFIRQAQSLPGGAAKPRNQLRVGFAILADLHRRHGSWHDAFRAYNGTGEAAERYARVMDARVAKWKHNLKLTIGRTN